MEELVKKIFAVTGDNDFTAAALEVFHYQAASNPVYKRWISELGVNPAAVNNLHDIPFMPVSFFRDHRVICDNREVELSFSSSGTTGMKRSTHLVADAEIYRYSCTRGFSKFYGPAEDYHILALLPSYLERKDSSLVYMVEILMNEGGSRRGGFYLNDYEALRGSVEQLQAEGEKIILLGVSFALLDFAEQGGAELGGQVVMETGGMKGRKKEITREELHGRLKEGFGTDAVHSEYGMTELLSQAYSKGEGLFSCPPWMRVLIRDPHDPFAYADTGVTGAINIIDLANIYSCSFIATSDLGRLYKDGRFEVSGRFDNSDMRGCSLLVV